MKAKVLDLTLPEWAWISGGEHEEGGDPLADRVVACHIRSASMIEFFLEKNFFPANPSVKTYSFTYENVAGIKEKHIAVLHYCAVTDDEEVIEDILAAAAEWYCDYLDWEDENILRDEVAKNN